MVQILLTVVWDRSLGSCSFEDDGVFALHLLGDSDKQTLLLDL